MKKIGKKVAKEVIFGLFQVSSPSLSLPSSYHQITVKISTCPSLPGKCHRLVSFSSFSPLSPYIPFPIHLFPLPFPRYTFSLFSFPSSLCTRHRPILSPFPAPRSNKEREVDIGSLRSAPTSPRLTDCVWSLVASRQR